MRRLRKTLVVVPALGLGLVLGTTCGTAQAAGGVRHTPPSQLAWPAAQAARAGQTARAAWAAPTSRTLRQGMSGHSVRDLQQRLDALHYYPGAVNGVFGTDTQEAVWAFQEVQGLTPQNDVTTAMWRALENPRQPKVLVPGGGSTRVEVNLAREYLVLYRDNQVALISHVSTGGHYYYCTTGGCATAVTPTGDYHTTAFMPGWVAVPLGYMYNPVFFIGTAFAIHGDTEVPLQPVSHGCVRIPMDIAQFFHTLVKTPGTPVYVRD
jgi:lipoprotein-anchoring transpeptidase ErfK/SrfK